MNNPHILTLALALASIIALASCSEEKPLRIGVSQCSSDDWRSKMNEEMRREIMFHPGATLEIRSADDSNAKQIADIRYFMDNHFDILIVAPNEAKAITPIVEEVYNGGMPVIVFDRNIESDAYTARIAVDNVAIGRSAAHYAEHLLGKSFTFIEIEGLPGSTPAAERREGFAQYIAGKPAMRRLASGVGNWNKDDAERVADSLLSIYNNVDLIFAHNDRMAIGAKEVARRRGIDSIKVIGVDAAPTIGIQAVADSIIDATFLYPTEGEEIIRAALAILRGEAVPREIPLKLASPVDLSNADILLLQNEQLNEETQKIRTLKAQVDEYWQIYSVQTSLFYAVSAILVLALAMLVVILRAHRQRRQHQEELERKNALLAEERDKQRQLNKQLDEATNAKLVFFTNVSHDLRTPLTLIAEPIDQLAKAENLTPTQRQLVEIAEKNVKTLNRLINQILDLRKFEMGMVQPNLAEADLAGLVEGIAKSFLPLAKRRGISLAIDIGRGEALAPTMAIDVEKMESVVLNLVSNAFKYTPDRGSIAVGFSHTADQATITVSDNGIGITPEELPTIFNWFEQAKKGRPNSSGIGLWITKAIAEMHGGSIDVKSQSGKGSTFTVSIPINHVSERAQDPSPITHHSSLITAPTQDLSLVAHHSSPNDDKPTLLIIDDNEDIRKLLALIAGDEYRVIAAANGNDGLRLAAKYVPDIIVCDVMMPGMDGMELCRKVKEELTTSHIPVLMLTACALDEQKIEGYESGADGYVAKPFNKDLLLARCRSLTQNRKRIKDLYDAAPQPTSAQPTPMTNQQTVITIDDDFYRKFLQKANERLADPDLSVDTLAADLGLGRSQFYRKIKALTGHSPVEILRNLRLRKARAMLAQTEKTISEIAYDTGFSTPAYFSKCYKDEYGETPSDLRERLFRS